MATAVGARSESSRDFTDCKTLHIVAHPKDLEGFAHGNG